MALKKQLLAVRVQTVGDIGYLHCCVPLSMLMFSVQSADILFVCFLIVGSKMTEKKRE